MKAVFFDLDNTLYNYDSANILAEKALYEDVKKSKPNLQYEVFKAKYAEAKNDIKTSLIGTASSHNRILYMQRLVEKLHGTIVSSTILSLYHSYWDTLVENSVLFDGVIDCFQWLKENKIKIFLVTNLTAYVQLRKIEKLGISDYIDYLVTSEESGYDKPHPASFLLALNKGELLPKEVFMVGDGLFSDIGGAHFVKIPAIWYMFGSKVQKSNVATANPEYVVSSFPELTTLFDKLIKE